MQTAIVIILWALVSVLVQSVVFPAFPSSRVWTDLIFYLVIIMGLEFKVVSSIAIICVLGFFTDSLSVAPHGTALVSYLGVFIFIHKIKENILIENRLSLFLWVLVFSLARQILQMVWMGFFVSNYYFSISTIFFMILQALWDSLLAQIFIPLLRKLLHTDFSYYFRRKGLRI